MKELLKELDRECQEFYGVGGLRFTGISIEKIKEIFKKRGVELEPPF